MVDKCLPPFQVFKHCSVPENESWVQTVALVWPETLSDSRTLHTHRIWACSNFSSESSMREITSNTFIQIKCNPALRSPRQKTLGPGQTRMRVAESSNPRSRSACNSRALSSTLMRSHRIWTCSNFSWESSTTFALVWSEVMIVDRSSVKETLMRANSHPRLTRALC